MNAEPIVFVCSHGQRFTEFELECGMRMSTIDHMMEIDEAEYQHQSDMATETELAREFALDESDAPWPWYADDPTIIVEPEVIQAWAGRP